MNSRSDSICQWDASWHWSRETTGCYSSELCCFGDTLGYRVLSFKLLPEMHQDLGCSPPQTKRLHSQTVPPSFHSSCHSEKESTLWCVAAAVARAPGFATDGMNRLQRLLLGVDMNGRRGSNYGNIDKNSPWNRSIHSHGGGAGIRLLQRLLQLQLI